MAVVNRKVIDLERLQQRIDEVSKRMNELFKQSEEIRKRMLDVSNLVQVHNKILYDDGGDAS